MCPFQWQGAVIWFSVWRVRGVIRFKIKLRRLQMPRLMTNFNKEIRSLIESSFTDWLLHEIAILRCDREALLVENSFLTEVSLENCENPLFHQYRSL